MANLSDSDRNSEWFDAPSDGPDGYREEPMEDKTCPMCGSAFPGNEDGPYCSIICAIDAENER